MLKNRIREGQRNEFQAVAEFFSTDALRAYKRVFGFVSNLQLQRAQLDYTGQNLLRVVRQTERDLMLFNEYRSSFYSMLIILQKVRIFLNRLAHYVLEEVLLLESIYIFGNVRATKDPHVLLAGLNPLLRGVLLALFIPSALSELHESVQQCIRNSSDFVGSISKFCVFIKHSNSDVLDALLLTSTDDETPHSEEEQQQQEQFHIVVFAISDSSANFEVRAIAWGIRGQIAQRPESRYSTPYWSKLNALLFEH
ncbi:hypothetical protein niasHT_039934 [Heterodera trifolii]|uniref:Uncharacterized protein n=1 Tax=Heterodera trifolii TaxID=157864 RepID=A0ABD2IF47_9BILA